MKKNIFVFVLGVMLVSVPFKFANATPQPVCNPEPQPVCDSEINLIQNGGFESPSIPEHSWSVITDTSVLKWLYAWVGEPTTGTEGIEIQRNITGPASEGSQFAELDGDHPTTIWQDIPTIIGNTYNLSFDYSPRAGKNGNDEAIDSTINLEVNNFIVDTLSGNSSEPEWGTHTKSFVATSTTTKVEFTDAGTDDSYGGYLDNVTLYCQPKAPEPTTGSIEITKYVCPADTTVVRSANGVDGTVPRGCTLQTGAKFGYVHGTQTDANADANGLYPELDATPTIGGSTVDGKLTINDLLADGRYLIVETNNDGQKLAPTDILGLYCERDGDSTDNNDNQELTFVPKGGVTHCVAYNKEVPARCAYNSDILASDEACVAPTPVCTDEQILVDNVCATPNPQTPTDLCINIDGNQEAVPTGMEVNNDKVCTEIQTSHSSRTGSVIHKTGDNGRVLGASTSCSPYLNSYIKYGDKNNNKDEVKKLQEFLNEHLGLKLKIDGNYGKGTFNAVKAFQIKYHSDVLLPWIDAKILKADSKGTGFVYKTTQRKINLIKCPELDLPMPALF